MDATVVPPALARTTSTDASPRKALEDALNSFHSILTSDQRDKLVGIGVARDPQTVIIFTAQLDHEMQQRKGRGVAGRFMTVLQSVHAFTTVVDTFVSSNPSIAALVWGSIKFALLAAVNITSYFEALSNLFMFIGGHCPRFAEYATLYSGSSRLQKALCDFHASIIRCCKHVVEVTQRPWPISLVNVLWKSSGQEFKSDVDAIQFRAKEVKAEIKLTKAYVDDVERMLQERDRVAASEQRRTLGIFMPKVEKNLESINRLQLQQSTRRSREKRQQLLEFLSSYDRITPFKEACQKRQCDTAEWIFTTPEFIRWCDSTESSLFWCSGKIGSGKTILCANVINYILAKKGPDTPVPFLFIQYDMQESLKAETIIRSIIRQVIDMTTMSESLQDQLDRLSRKHFVELRTWVQLAQKVIKDSNTSYIFIDGLDESEPAERRALLIALSSVASSCPGLRIFIAGRDSVGVDLKDRFKHIERVRMSPEVLNTDIRLYVEAIIQQRIETEDLIIGDPALLDDIKQRLTEHADGMFLWVRFLVDELCTATYDDEARQFLHCLPLNLEETFSRALSRIVTRQRKKGLAQKLFRWIATAKEPLSLDELREAVSIEIKQEYSMPGRLVHELSRITLWCENLVQVTEEGNLVQFAHITVRDFLVGMNLPKQLSDFHVDLEEADHFVGEICVTFLHFNDFKTTIAQRPQPLLVNPMAIASNTLDQQSRVTRLVKHLKNIRYRESDQWRDLDVSRTLASYQRVSEDTLEQGHPFLRYARKNWVFHTTRFSMDKSITWSLWYQMVTHGHDLAYFPWGELDGHEAVFIWSHETCHYALLRYGIKISDQSESQSDHMIQQSAQKGDVEAISILLEHGNCSKQGVSLALQAASRAGHPQVVERLLTAGADVNAPTRSNGRTALQEASEGGYLQVIEQLLTAGADINATPAKKGGRTVLQAASAGGHLQVVERLLTAGADINNRGDYGQTALYTASGGGHLQVVERLLTAGADINAPGEHGRTALYTASAGGHLQVIEQLLTAGADINAAPAIQHGRTALQAASGGGYLQVIERLLTAGADINAAPAREGGRTALQAASAGGHLQVVERLLTAGADINAAPAEEGGRTALQAASAGGHLQVIEQLLTAGADINAAPAIQHGRTALQAASGGGHLQVVERLLTAGADINAAPAIQHGRTALQAASAGGHLQVVERLLTAGADINAAPAEEGGQTALQAASAGGRLQVVERLLTAGAIINDRAGGYGRTARQVASRGGNFQVVELLRHAESDLRQP